MVYMVINNVISIKIFATNIVNFICNYNFLIHFLLFI